MITLDNIKTSYILPLLTETGYAYNVVTDVGEFEKAKRYRNSVNAPINCLLMLTGSEVQQLNGGLIAMAYQATLSFLLPVGDGDYSNEGTDANAENGAPYNNEFPNVTVFRDKLSKAFSTAQKIAVSDSDGNVYEGGISYALPTVGQRQQRDLVGDSIIYTCTFAVAFLQNAINTSDIILKIDDARVAFSSIRISRTPALTPDILKSAGGVDGNGESTAYAESAMLKVEFSVPALKGVAYSTAILQYILGTASANAVHTVSVSIPIGEDQSETITQQMIFAGGEFSGSGVTNVVYNVSLTPYTAPEELGG